MGQRLPWELRDSTAIIYDKSSWRIGTQNSYHLGEEGGWAEPGLWAPFSALQDQSQAELDGTQLERAREKKEGKDLRAVGTST